MPGTISDKGFKKLLESRLEALNFELGQMGPTDNPVGARAENLLQIQKQEILKQLEEIETEELIVKGELIRVNGKVYPGGGNTPTYIPKSGTPETDAMNLFMGEVFDECLRATDVHGGFNSAHEAYGVILEEVDEFWDEVKKKRRNRDKVNMRRELVQVAAMAMKAALTIV